MKTFLYLLTLSILVGCGEVEYSPNQKFDANTPRDINKKNLEKLYKQKDDDTVRFVLTGDTQRAYSACEEMVTKINSLENVDFVVINGDISDFGLYKEMEWVNEIYSKIKIPYIGVLGNHDMNANGRDVYRRMYGDENFCFVYDSVKFVCYDSNSREYKFNGKVPNLNWVADELKPQDGVSNYVAISHIPSFIDDFDPNLEKPYAELITGNKKVLASMHAHINQSRVYYPYNTTTPFIVANTAAEKEFYLIEIAHGKLSHKVINF